MIILCLFIAFLINDTTYLISPELNTIDGDHYAEFQIKTNFVDATFQYGTMSDNSDSSTYLPISDWLSLDSTYTQITTENIPANSGHQYFVIKTSSPSQHTSIRVDDFLWAKNIDTTTNTVGILENEILDLKVFPNPSNGIVNIKTNEDITSIKLHNLLGALVAEYKNTTAINVSQYMSGIYFLEINTLNNKQIVKLKID